MKWLKNAATTAAAALIVRRIILIAALGVAALAALSVGQVELANKLFELLWSSLPSSPPQVPPPSSP